MLERLGVPIDGLVLADGSGLSRQNRIAAVTLARALEVAYEDDGRLVETAADRAAGRRFHRLARQPVRRRRERPEAGDIRAKTGYLTGVVSLAGYVVDADGRPLIFAVLADAVVPASTLDAQRTTDQFAARLAGCGCS